MPIGSSGTIFLSVNKSRKYIPPPAIYSCGLHQIRRDLLWQFFSSSDRSVLVRFRGEKGKNYFMKRKEQCSLLWGAIVPFLGHSYF